MTFSGLNNNIELSSVISLDLSIPSELQALTELMKSFETMVKSHPKHVFAIADNAHAEALFSEGRLADETIIPAPSPTSENESKKGDGLPRMTLWRVDRAHLKAKAIGSAKKKGGAPKSATPLSTARYLVWKSNPLRERDLNIPEGKNTNPTGSMGLKMGAFDDIDHRHYFRNDVFSGLNWVADNPPKKKERAAADFELVIKNVDYGSFQLTISHNPDKTSKTYKQRNMMTHLHWGQVLPLIQRKDLLGRTLLLYRQDATPPTYTIEID